MRLVNDQSLFHFLVTKIVNCHRYHTWPFNKTLELAYAYL
jgi:hypothetical protein